MIEQAPGSSLWLLRYELLQYFRHLQRAGQRSIIILVGVLLFIMLVIGAPLSLRLRDASFSINVPLIVLLDGIAALLFTLMLSTALLQATTAFYGRGDLDLLLSSPLPHARILRIRWAGIIISVASLFGIMVTPILVPFIILERWQTVGIYCVDLALALAATATGLLVATSWPRCWALLWA